jgi:SPOR domain
MSDDNRADPTEEEIVLADEDRLPWLEAVEEDQEESGPSIAKLVAAILIGLVAIGVIVGGLYWLGNRGPAGADNQIITAEKGDYKQVPANRGGMNVSGEGPTSQAASQGAQPKGNLNTGAVPEAPVAPGQAAPAPAPAPQPARPAPGPARPAPPAPAPAPAASGPTIQLGAFSNPAAAENAWRALAGRFRYLAPLGHRVVAGPSGGRTVHRLFASGANARDVCNRLRAAGEACIPQ